MVKIALIIATPLELIMFLDNLTIKTTLEEFTRKLYELITLILNDNDLMSMPLEEDCVNYILNRVKVYDSTMLTFGEYDQMLAKGIIRIQESIFKKAMELKSDSWRLIEVISINQNSVELNLHYDKL